MPAHRTSPARSGATTASRVAGLVLVLALALLWTPRGAPDVGHGPSALPSLLRPVSLAHPRGPVSEAATLARGHVSRRPLPLPLPLRVRFALVVPWLVGLAVAVLVTVVAVRGDRFAPAHPRLVLRSRAPPLVP